MKKEMLKEIEEIFFSHLEKMSDFNEQASIYEVYDHPILFIGYRSDWDEYELYSFYTRCIPSYIDVIKIYDDENISLEEIIQDFKNIQIKDPLF